MISISHNAYKKNYWKKLKKMIDFIKEEKKKISPIQLKLNSHNKNIFILLIESQNKN
jgi:hypothetical protein